MSFVIILLKKLGSLPELSAWSIETIGHPALVVLGNEFTPIAMHFPLMADLD